MSNPFSLCVLVATIPDRRYFLLSRALESVRAQTRAPDRRLLIVDHQKAIDSWRIAHPDFELLSNGRATGASGTWNTGLDHLARTETDLRHVYVAFLDDDDEWRPSHLADVAAVLESDDLDVIATPFDRVEPDGRRHVVRPPLALKIGDFLVGNPGIQSSNLVCRLETLLEADLFDESFQSCIDRDLCVRIAALPSVRFGVTTEPTVLHHACACRPRLSILGSASKTQGLDMFWAKYRPLMSDAEAQASAARAKTLFDWSPKRRCVNDVQSSATRPRTCDARKNRRDGS